jgi:hypothetical protein
LSGLPERIRILGLLLRFNGQRSGSAHLPRQGSQLAVHLLPPTLHLTQSQPAHRRQNHSESSYDPSSSGGATGGFVGGCFAIMLGFAFLKFALNIADCPGGPWGTWWCFGLLWLFSWTCGILCIWQGINLTYKIIGVLARV